MAELLKDKGIKMSFIILNQEGLFDGPYNKDALDQALAISGGVALEIPLDKINYDNEKGEMRIDLSLDEWKTAAEKAINKAAYDYRQKFVPDALIEEYKIKEIAAQAYLDDKATDEQIAILDTNDTNIETEAKAISQKAKAFSEIWPLIIAKRMQSNKAIRRAENKEAILNILQKSQIEVCAIIEPQKTTLAEELYEPIDDFSENSPSYEISPDNEAAQEDSFFYPDTKTIEEYTPFPPRETDYTQVSETQTETTRPTGETHILNQILPLLLAQQIQEGGASKTTESLEQILALLKSSQS